MELPRRRSLEDTKPMSRPPGGWTAARASDRVRPLPLTGGRDLDDLEIFARALEPCTTVTGETVAGLARLAESSLVAESIRTDRAEARLREILIELTRHPSRVTERLDGLDPSLFTDELGWPQILGWLQPHRGSRYDEHKRLALVKLREYLLHRRDELRRLCQLGASRVVEKRGRPAAGEYPHRYLRSMVGRPRRRRCLDNALDLVKLERGETTGVAARRGDKFDLRLASRAFRILHADVPVMIDEHGECLRLREGSNMIGRATHNDAVIRSEFADVSRRHLQVEVRRGLVSQMIDLSSAGTFLPRSRAL